MTQLKGIKKQRLAWKHLLKIKKVVDSLAAVGFAINDAEYVEVILDGLSEQYAPLIRSVLS